MQLYALGAVAATYMVWRLLFKLAGSFINATGGDSCDSCNARCLHTMAHFRGAACSTL